MQRRKGSGIYEFRKRLPTALAGKPCPANLRIDLAEIINPGTGLFKRELTISLGTTDHHLAKRRDLKQAARVTDLFDLAQRLVANGGSAVGSTASALEASFPSPEEIETEIIAGILADDEKARDDGDDRFHTQTPEERAQWPDLEAIDLLSQPHTTDTFLEFLGEDIDDLSQDYRKAQAKRDFSIVKPELHAYLRAHNLPRDPNSPFYRKAGLAVLSGHVKAYDLLKQRQGGDVVPTPEVKPVAVTKGPKLSEALAQWKQGSHARGGRQPSRNSVVEAERAVRYFTQWHQADLPLGEIDKAKARDFRNALAQMPTRLTAKQRAIPFRRLIESVGKAGAGNQSPAHATTVNKSMNLLAAIVSAAEKDGLTDCIAGFANPFRNMTIATDQRNEDGRREPFSESQLASLFATGVFTSGLRPRGGGGEAAFWFPLLALLTGARLNEIAQLRVADIRQDPDSGRDADPIWFMDIGTEGGRSIKTASSRRKVPLHAELLRLGLLRYREARLAEKGVTETDSLWPDVQSEDGVYSATAFTKFFGRFLRKTAGITERAIVFHSFRHSFKRLCRDAGLTEELHDALTGHSSGGSVGRSYGAGFGLKALSEGVGRITAPPCLQSVRPWENTLGRAQRR